MNTQPQENAQSITDFTLSELIARTGYGNSTSQEFIIAHSGAADLEAFHFPCRIPERR